MEGSGGVRHACLICLVTHLLQIVLEMERCEYQLLSTEKTFIQLRLFLHFHFYSSFFY